jgi:L-arabinonolactonase
MKIFSNEACQLGEGPMWHPERNSLFWLDILNRNLFEKSFENEGLAADRSWFLPEYTSVLAHDKNDKNILWMVTDKSFGKFDLKKHAYHPVLNLGLENSFRANDGGVSPKGTLWFGSMEWSPSGINGSIYSISASAKLQKQSLSIGVPNTFCWSLNGAVLYISDSYQQKVFSFTIQDQILDNKSAHVFADLSDGESTPDGGAINCDGFLWNAHWDGHKVVKYNDIGELQREILMPVPKPTSCCFGGVEYRNLFVTSARTTMSKQELIKYPMSGNVFVEKRITPGRPSLPYCLEI